MIIFLLIIIIYDGNDFKMPKEFEDDNKYYSYKVFEMHWIFFYNLFEFRYWVFILREKNLQKLSHYFQTAYFDIQKNCGVILKLFR